MADNEKVLPKWLTDGGAGKTDQNTDAGASGEPQPDEEESDEPQQGDGGSRPAPPPDIIVILLQKTREANNFYDARAAVALYEELRKSSM